MKDMKKINERFRRNTDSGNSDIYRKFSEQFDSLFNAEEIATNEQEFEEIYVEDIEFEHQIEVFRHSRSDMSKFCVGYTGIGKTTCIRHCFGLGVSNEAQLNMCKKEIIFPTFLDGYRLKDIQKFDLTARIAAVCSKLELMHPDLKELIRSEEGKKEFYEFIGRHTSFALECINPIEAMDMDEKQLIRAKLNGAYEKNAYEFQANLLKFYITKKYDCYERLIIILDDIESLPENYQKETIAAFLKFHHCMQNTDYPQNGNFHINLLMSIRPHTLRLINKDNEVQAFPVSEPAILKKDAVNLNELFIKRFDYYTKNSTNVIGNINTWRICYDALQAMNTAFEGKYKDMIINLCLMNARKALACYAHIFANRFWVQKNKPKDDFFTIRQPEYSFNNINVIRALACKEEEVYWGDENSILPNIFKTSKQEDLSICCLLVMSYFREKRGTAAYGLNAEHLSTVKEEWKNIFGNDISKKFIEALEFLYENKHLRKSIKDFEDIDSPDTKETLNDNTLLYISPRGAEVLEMLRRDSVLLEMLRESSWRDYESWDYSDKTSSELMKEGKQKDIFGDLLEYISYLSEMESDILSTVKVLGKQAEYIAAFSDVPLSRILLEGVENSLNYSGIMQDNDIKEKFRVIKVRVNNIMNKF